MAQALPPSAEAYGVAQRAEIAQAVGSIRRSWLAMGSEFDSSWERVAPRVLLALDTAQQRIADGAAAYVPRVMAEVGMPVPSPSFGFDRTQLVGVAGDGLPTESLMYGAVTRSKAAVGQGASWAQGLVSGGNFLTTAASTVLSDTARTVEHTTGNALGVKYYVRMLEAPSCGRCVILAGKRTRSSEAFRRHPRCDCRNIPAAESIAGNYLVDPDEYLGHLDDKALAKTLGSEANATAYRKFGADAGQLVNASRGGIRTAQQFDRTVKYTTEGTTTRGIAGRRMAARGTQEELAGTAARQTTTGPQMRVITRTRATAPRLMPETIFEIAADDAHARQLLGEYGWLL